MTTTIVCIVLGELSSGELLIAYEFAHRLPPDRYAVYFVTSPRGQVYLEKNGIQCVVLRNLFGNREQNLETFDRLVKKVRPDYFLLSDVYTSEFASSWSGVSFEHLRTYGIPIVGVDEYEYVNAGYTQDYYAGLPKKLPPLVEACDYSIRNCPLNKPQPAPDRIQFFSLYSNAFHSTPESRKDVRKHLGVPPGSKVVFMANSNWESLNVNRLPALGTLLYWVPKIILNYLLAVGVPLTIVHVGPNKWNLANVPEHLINYVYFDFLNPADFDRYLLNSDLFVTTNLVSVTLSKAIFGAVPSIVIQNHKVLDFGRFEKQLQETPAWYRQMAQEVKIAYPFRLFPFGWYNFLKTVLHQNPYQDTYAEVSLFKQAEAKETLRRYLLDESAIAALKERQREYVESLLKLPSPAEILERFAAINVNA